MKKSGLIIQSIVFLAVSVSLLTVAAFAWFAIGLNPSVKLEIAVVGTKSVKVTYFRGNEDGTIYTEAVPSVALIDGEIMYPGKAVYCRIDVENPGQDVAEISLRFKNVSIAKEPKETDEKDSAFIAGLSAFFVIETVALNAGELPDYNAVGAGKPQRVEFLDGLKNIVNTSQKGDIQVIENIVVLSQSTKSIYYRFYLDEQLDSLDAVFSINAQTIEVYAK